MIVPPGDSAATPLSSSLKLISFTKVIEPEDLCQEVMMEEAQQYTSADPEGLIDMNGLFEFYDPQVIEESDDEFNDWLNSLPSDPTDQAEEAQRQPNILMMAMQEANIDLSESIPTGLDALIQG